MDSLRELSGDLRRIPAIISCEPPVAIVAFVEGPGYLGSQSIFRGPLNGFSLKYAAT